MTKHTPTPWVKSIVQFDKSEWAKLWNKNQICIAKGIDITAIVYGPDDQEEANAAFIVRAINSHEELLQALKDLAREIDLRKLNIRKDFSLMSAHAFALKAIAKAEGK